MQKIEDFLLFCDSISLIETLLGVGVSVAVRIPWCSSTHYLYNLAQLLLREPQIGGHLRPVPQKDAPQISPPPGKTQGRRIVSLHQKIWRSARAGLLHEWMLDLPIASRQEREESEPQRSRILHQQTDTANIEVVFVHRHILDSRAAGQLPHQELFPSLE